MDYEKLGLVVENAIDDILEEPKSEQYRCHEISRKMTSRLLREGYSAESKDGNVCVLMKPYIEHILSSEYTLPSNNYQYDCDMKHLLELIKEYPEEDRVFQMHSWTEIGDYIAEYYRNLEFKSTGICIGEQLVQGRKEDIGKIINRKEDGTNFMLMGSKFIYYPPFSNLGGIYVASPLFIGRLVKIKS